MKFVSCVFPHTTTTFVAKFVCGLDYVFTHLYGASVFSLLGWVANPSPPQVGMYLSMFSFRGYPDVIIHSITRMDGRYIYLC